eukprot:TRINITY_DN365_c0_g1_i1.p2 TRINITY_DN365_c0_g1~~TRINITY_DN365_c0_g1_i1.p2  ORF type:complete len:143 (+),score=41.28 TRINITY_DN365_c0_g1_i1:56-484(+)
MNMVLLESHAILSIGSNKKGFTMAKGNKKANPASDVVTVEATVNLHKRLHGVTFKKRAPRAIKEIKKFASKLMKTEDVRVDVNLNKFVWSNGVKSVPTRVRVRLHRKRNEDEESGDKLYTLVTYVPVDTFSGLDTKTVEDDE